MATKVFNYLASSHGIFLQFEPSVSMMVLLFHDLDPAEPGTDPDKPDPDPVAAEYVPGSARSSFITKKIR